MRTIDHVLYNGAGQTKYAPMEKKATGNNEPGFFAGWVSEDHDIAWVVSPHRADQRTGAIDSRPMDDYTKELLAVAVPWARYPIPRWPPVAPVPPGKFIPRRGKRK